MFKYLAYLFVNKILGHFYLPFKKKKKKDLQGFVSRFFCNKVLAFGVTLQGSFLSLSSV